MIILKIVFLFLAILMSLINFSRINYRMDVPSLNFVLQSIGIVGFIVIQFNLL